LNNQTHLSPGLSDVTSAQSTTEAVEAADQMASADNLSLIASLLSGDEDAFLSLLQCYHSSMIRLALVYVPDDAGARLAVEEAWMAVLQNLDQLQPHESLKIEIHRTLINLVRSRQPQAEYSLPSAQFNEAPHAQDTNSWRFFQMGHPQSGSWVRPPRRWYVSLQEPRLSREIRVIIERAIERLPLDQREVIVLHDVEGWAPGEVSALLHLARSFVRQRVEEYFDGQTLFQKESST
jgi:RNA polymerase sigma-70 factor, ECF subfamily